MRQLDLLLRTPWPRLDKGPLPISVIRVVSAFPSTFGLAGDTAGSSRAQPALGEGPLTASQRYELTAARDRAKAIRKASRVAAFNGWTAAIIAACSLPFALFDRSGLILAVGLAIVAFNEFRGRKRLLMYDPSAATLLGWNQLAFLMMIVAYCLWSLYSSLGDTGTLSNELKQYHELDQALGAAGGGFENLVKSFTYGLYGGVIVLSLIFQGGNALYYFSRRRHVEDFIAETPDWVREVQSL